MLRPTKISDFPWVVVRIECVLCPRKGAYRLARLAARYGPEQSLEGMLADLAHDCPWWRSDPRKYEVRCGARFVDLERNLPPPDVPDALVFRQRQLDREDVPPARRIAGRGWNGDVPMLSGWPMGMVTITCDRCGRRDSFVKANLLLNLGDLRLTDLLKRLTADCSKATETAIYELCRARYDLPLD